MIKIGARNFTDEEISMLYRIGYKLKLFIREIEFTFERAKKGYSRYDLWDMDSWFLSIVPKMLREFAKNTHTWPGEGKYEEIKTFEDWQNEINNIAKLFEEAAEDPLDCDDWQAKNKEIDEKKDKALDLIKKYFWDLWD